MKHKTFLRQAVSVLLAFVLALGLVLPSLAVESADVTTESGKKLTFEQVDNDEYDVSLPNKNDVNAEDKEDTSDYEDTEIVRVSIVLDTPSTLEKGFTADDISSQSRRAVRYRRNLQNEQEKVEEAISDEVLDGGELDVVWNLTLAANIISANVEYGQIKEIEKVDGVKEVLVEKRYDPCVVNRDETVDPKMSTSDEMIGSIAAWASGYTGAGRKIAIIDTGADIDHPSLDPDAFAYAVKDSGAKLMTAEDTAGLLSQLNVVSKNKNVTAEQLYVDAKIPYGFNYVDNGLDIGHDHDTAGDHGSHVAGIAAANRYVKSGDGYASALDSVLTQGVAPDAQILVMKVFGKSGGAYPGDYMAAIEDAIVLGADSANLSLGGAWTGDSRAEAKYEKILERVVESGLVVVASAGNSGAWADETIVGAPYADSASWATVGAPSTFTNMLSVASVENIGRTGKYIEVAENKMYYSENLDGRDGKPYTNVSITTLAGEHEYVYLDSIGTAEDFASIKDVLTGKIAICNRGKIDFTQKAENAVANGAIATIIANNEPGTLLMDFAAYTKTEPAISITQKDAALVKENSTPVKDASGNVLYYTGKMVISAKVEATIEHSDYYTVSSFSSWGIPGSLKMKPEIIAPGGNIYSLMNGGSYQNMSGTSMAAPQVSGMAALLAQHIDAKGLTEKTGLTRRALMQSLLMSTAEPMLEAENTYYPVLRQGAGLANIGAAISAGSYLMMDADATDSYKDGKIKAELGDDPARTGTFSFGYTINNLSDTASAFSLSADFFTQGVYTDDGVAYEDTMTVPVPSTVTFLIDGKLVETSAPEEMKHCDFNGDGKITSADGQALLDYVTGVREKINDAEYADFDADGGIDTYDAYLFFKQIGKTAVEVPANESVHVTVNVALDKNTLDAYDKASGDTGTYIEGYVYATELASAEGVEGTSHSIPVLGYYGNWTDSSMFDVGSYIDYFVSGEEDRLPYMFDRTSNDSLQYQLLTTREKGDTSTYAFGGNPFINESFYDPARDSINTDTTVFDTIAFTAIRNFANSHISLVDTEGKVYIDADTGGNTGAFYKTTADGGQWQNIQWSISLGDDLSATPEDAQLQLALTLAPEYNVDPDGTTHWDALGNGATKVYSAYVDKTAPTITDISMATSITSDTKKLTVTASDNRYIATVALIDYDTGKTETSQSTPAGAEAGHADLFEVEMDAEMQAATHLLVQVYDYAGNYATYKINLNEEELNGPVSVELSEDSLSLFRGAYARLTAEVSPFGVKPDGVTWSSSNEKVATVSANGLVTAVNEGTATITAASVKDPTATASCEVTVKVFHTTISGALQDDKALAQFYKWNLETDAVWNSTAVLESTSVAAAAYDELNSRVYLIDGDQHNFCLVDPATGKNIATYGGIAINGSNIPVWDLAYSKYYSTADKPLYTGIFGIYVLPLSEPGEFSNSAFDMSYSLRKTGGKKLISIAQLGNAMVTPTWNTVEGEIYALIDDAGYVHIGAFCDEEEVGELSFVGWDWFKSTLPELACPGSGDDLFCSMVATEEDGATVLYLSYFNGDASDLYRLTYTTNGVPAKYSVNDSGKPEWDPQNATHLWVAEYAGNFGNGVWPASIYSAVPNQKSDTTTTTADGSAAARRNPEFAGIKSELTQIAQPAFTPVPTESAVTPASGISISEDEKTVTVTVVPQGDDENTNGLLTVEYDADLLTLADVSSVVPYTSHKDESGKVTFGYVAPDGLAANNTVATLTFTLDPTKCSEASVGVTLKQTEQNDKTVDVTEHLATGIHKETEVRDAKEPTCTEKGYTGDTYCKACGELLEKGKDIDALGHTYKNGKCTRCGEKQDNVKTGDESNLNIWFVVLTMSAAITVFAAAVLLRKKRSN